MPASPNPVHGGLSPNPAGLLLGITTSFLSAAELHSESDATIKEYFSSIRKGQNVTITWQADVATQEGTQQIDQLTLLQDGWNSYNAKKPSQSSARLARQALQIIRRDYFSYPHVLPSAEGGIVIAFSQNGKYAHVEALNSGNVLTVAFSREEAPIVKSFGSTQEALSSAVETVRNFLFG